MKHIFFISVLLLMFCTSVSAQRFPYPPGGGSSSGGGASWLANGTYSIGWPDTTGVKILNDGQVLTAGRVVALEDSVTLTVAPNETIDLSRGNNFRFTLTQNDTLGFVNPIDGQVIQITVTNAGAFTLLLSGVGWPGDTPPVITAVANKRTKLSLHVSGGMIDGVAVTNYP